MPVITVHRQLKHRPLYTWNSSPVGDAENARNDIARPSKLWGLTTRDRTTRDQIAGTDIARKDIARPGNRD